MSTDGTSAGRGDGGYAATPPDPFIVLRATDPRADSVAPDPDFARRLRDRLEQGARLPKGIIMDTTGLERTPAVISTAAADPTAAPAVERAGALPYLTVADPRAAIDWYIAHLGARLRGEPIVMDDGRIGHAELEMGGGAVYLAAEFPDMGLHAPAPGHVSVSLMLPVDDTDAVLGSARAGEAIITREPYENYGTRNAALIDPFGHRWMLAGPARVGVGVPADIVEPGDLVYLSLQTPDIERAARFYSAVLGWQVDVSARQVTNLGHRLGLYDGRATDHDPAAAIDYGTNTLYCVYAVDDFDTARERIIAAGGRAGEVTEVSRDGTRVLDAVDNQGVAFSVHVPTPDQPRSAQHPSAVGEMSYLTVHTPDSGRFRDFYSAVLGWTFRGGRVDDGWEVTDVHPQVGVAGGGAPSAVPMWNVADMDAAVERVRAAGGRVIDEPQTQPYGIMALCADDQGADFYLGQLF